MNTTIHLSPTVAIAILLAVWGIYRTSNALNKSDSETFEITQTVGPTIYSMGLFLFGITVIPTLNIISITTVFLGIIGTIGLYSGVYCISVGKNILSSRNKRLHSLDMSQE
jgi:hypothetical protein